MILWLRVRDGWSPGTVDEDQVLGGEDRLSLVLNMLSLSCLGHNHVEIRVNS